MAFNGSGVFNRIYNWTQDAANAIDITASRVDTEDTGFATGLTNCVTRDGQGKMGSDFLPGSANAYALGSAGVPWTQIVTTAFQSTKLATQSWSPTAAALVDATTDLGTFTGTFTGMTAGVAVAVQFFRVGNRVSLMFPQTANGTSNANTFTMTGLPAGLQPPATAQTVELCVGAVANNGALVGANSPFNAQASVNASGTITFYLGSSNSGWTTSGTKGFINFSHIDYYLI